MIASSRGIDPCSLCHVEMRSSHSLRFMRCCLITLNRGESGEVKFYSIFRTQPVYDHYRAVCTSKHRIRLRGARQLGNVACALCTWCSPPARLILQNYLPFGEEILIGQVATLVQLVHVRTKFGLDLVTGQENGRFRRTVIIIG